MEYFIYAQIFGGFALILEIARFQLKNSKNFFYFEPFLSTSYFMQFYLLNAQSAFLISLISIVRSFCGIGLNDKHLRLAVIYGFVPVYVAATLIHQYDNIIDYLPLFAILASTYAFTCKENRYLVARLYILNASLWFIYAATVSAYATMAACVLIGTSVIIGILRHEGKAKAVLTTADQTIKPA